MMGLPPIHLLYRVIVIGMTVCALPHTAWAQIRSIHAIRYVTLAPPPPGMEQLHEDLAGYWRQATMLVEAPETLDDRFARQQGKFDSREALWIDPRARAARCRLRRDLPQPRTIGLECSDYAGKYVGLVRVATADDLMRWVKEALQSFTPAAMPLTTVRGILSGQSMNVGVTSKHVEFMKNLLRTDGTFTVLDSDAGMSADERDSLLYFDLWAFAGGGPGNGQSRLVLKDRFGNSVRRWEVTRPRSLPWRPGFEEAIKRLVDQMLMARREDEEIYRVPPPGQQKW